MSRNLIYDPEGTEEEYEDEADKLGRERRRVDGGHGTGWAVAPSVRPTTVGWFVQLLSFYCSAVVGINIARCSLLI